VCARELLERARTRARISARDSPPPARHLGIFGLEAEQQRRDRAPRSRGA
jgi:hypothetical protein